MIGIYNDNFLKYLKDNLSENIKVTSKNIIIPCPFCEYGKEKDHYHMYISLDIPIYHCFKANCEQSGTIKKLIKKIEGKDISDQFVDKNKLNEITKKREIFTKEIKHNYTLPPLKEHAFLNKSLYLKKRFKFANYPFDAVKGLIFDVDEFLKVNQIPLDEKLFRIKDYLHSNFIGFMTEHNNLVVFRNIDDTQKMKYFKLYLNNNSNLFLDYYKLHGNNPNSNTIVLAEGIFDIYSAYLFDILNIKNDVKLYASVLSSKYASLIHSLVYHEQIFRPNIIILSDNNINLDQYENLKYYNNHIVESLSVYYNKVGKDFGESPVIPIKNIISTKNKKNGFRTKYKKIVKVR